MALYNIFKHVLNRKLQNLDINSFPPMPMRLEFETGLRIFEPDSEIVKLYFESDFMHSSP